MLQKTKTKTSIKPCISNARRDRLITENRNRYPASRRILANYFLARGNKMYYNSTNQTGHSLKRCKQKAESQDNVVLAFFREHSQYHYSPSEIWEKCFTVKTPLTSIRRSINTLTRNGKLIRTTIMQNSPYGRPEHLWKVAA